MGYGISEEQKCTLTHTASMPSVTPLFTNPIEIQFIHSGGDTTLRVQPDANTFSFSFYYPYSIDNIIIDPENDIINNTGSVIITASSLVGESKNIIYPNPANELLYIVSAEKYDSYTITDINGKICEQGNISGNSIPLSLENTGIYHLTLKGNSTIYNSRFVFMKWRHYY